MPAPILIACVGNADVAGDDLGPRVARRLRERRPADFEVVDLGSAPGRLLDMLGGRRTLIIVDAVIGHPRFDGPLIDLEWPTASPVRSAAPRRSTHGLSIADQLELAERLDLLPPHVRIVGWQVNGAGVIHGVADAAVDRVVARIIEHGTSTLGPAAASRRLTAMETYDDVAQCQARGRMGGGPG